MNLKPQEEILVELFRQLAPEQRRELLKGLRALVDANRLSQKKMKRPLDVVGNARIEQRFGLPPAPGKKKPKKKRTQRSAPPRPPGTPLDDALGTD